MLGHEPISMEPGTRVLVTGGASGIGRVIADTFVARGARVFVCDVSSDALDRHVVAQPTILTRQTDVADAASVDHLFDAVGDAWGGLDVLINNAGIAGPTADVEAIDPEAWRRTVAVNLDGQFHCLRRAVPMLKRASRGSIVAVSSVAGRLGYARRLPYAATKWAIIGMTASLAKELGPYGIRVNAVLPGFVEGPRMDGVIRDRAAAEGVSFETMKTRYLERVSLRRMVGADEVADTVLFLCSHAARSISGQAISVCGNVETL